MKKISALLLFVLLFDFLTPSAFAATLTDDACSGEFNSGSYVSEYTQCSSDQVSLSASGKSNGSGEFNSQIFDAGESTSWSTLSWVPVRPSMKELPDSSGADSGYSDGNINMTGNKLLYHLNESSGDIIDSSLTSSDGTVSGSPNYNQTGVLNGALKINSQSGAVVDTNSAWSNFVSNDVASVSFWVNPTGTPATRSASYQGENIVGTTGSARYFGVYRAVIGGEDKIWAYNWDTNEDRVGTTYSKDAWNHIAVVHSSGTLSIYFNGSFVDSVASGNTGALNGELHLGGQSLTATLDEVAVFNRALTANEIEDIYLRGAGRVKFQVRSCDDAACSGETFIGPNGTGSTYYSELTSTVTTTKPSKTLSSVSDNQYFQYKAVFESEDNSATALIDSVSVVNAVSGGGGGGGGEAVSEYPAWLYALVIIFAAYLLKTQVYKLQA